MKATPSCYRCGGEHLATVCRYRETICRYCKKKGHLERVCRAKLSRAEPKRPNYPRKNCYIDEDQRGPDPDAYDMFTLTDKFYDPIVIQVTINGVPIKMEMDTGASVSVISKATYQMISSRTGIEKLQESTVKLKTYTGEPIPVLGTVSVKVSYNNCELELFVQVVDGKGPDLMGRDWLTQFKVALRPVNSLESLPPLKEVLEKHAEVFNDQLGCLQGQEIKLIVKENAQPKFFKPRTVPLVLRGRVEAELQRLEEKGIISPVQFSQWAAPIVPVVKRDGNVRICGDYKVTINQAIKTESYPLPRVDELFANLSGGKYFSKLDLSNAYLQLPIEEVSKEFLVINTHKGLFKYNRLPFGVSSAPAIFQRCMETLLRGEKGVSVYLDDILITGATIQDHLANLEGVLQKLQNAGLRLNRTKCSFMKTSIEYLGHIIDHQGLHPTEKKVQAIQEAPKPKNLSELRSFLGIVNYYNRFLPNLSTKLTPLYALLSKQAKWHWSPQQDEAFHLAKKALQKDSLVVHFDESKPVLLACDASQYGLGAVLSHIMDNGLERPIAYASRTLTAAEKNYSQLEKEGLAIVYGVKKFHNYLYGRQFQIESDHQPLSHLFNETKGVPQMASSRIQRWALTLSAYQYSIRYKPGKSLSNADALSRLPQPTTISVDGLPGDLVHLINHLATTGITAENIREWTDKDPTLSQVRHFVMLGWPDSVPGEEFRPFNNRKSELSVLDGCLLWGSRVIVPPQGQQLVLNELHDSHPGCTRMKALARSYVWWPQMNAEIEEVVKQCPNCQESRPSPAMAPLHPWEWPSHPWQRLHLDFAGPFLGHMYLVLVDAHSKWMEVHLMQSITASKTIESLRIIFSTHGLPRTIVTDNGPTFTSSEFAKFVSSNSIRHIKSSPYHPSTNGLAERAVQSLKQGLKRNLDFPVQERLSKFLFKYRITPHSTTDVPPSELLMGRRLRSRLDCLYPDRGERVSSQQQKQKRHHDNSKSIRYFNPGDKVFAEMFQGNLCRWLPGAIVKVTGLVSYHVKLNDGRLIRRHVDSIRRRETNDPVDISSKEQGNPSNLHSDLYLPDIPQSNSTSIEQTQEPTATNSQPQLRRSTRHRKPPNRYGQ